MAVGWRQIFIHDLHHRDREQCLLTMQRDRLQILLLFLSDVYCQCDPFFCSVQMDLVFLHSVLNNSRIHLAADQLL